MNSTKKALVYFLLKTEKKDKKITVKEFETKLNAWLDNVTLKELEAFKIEKEMQKKELQEACDFLIETDPESYKEFNNINNSDKVYTDRIKNKFGKNSIQYKEFSEYFLLNKYYKRMLQSLNAYIKTK